MQTDGMFGKKEKKKILMLSLGTGSILGMGASKMTMEEKREKLAKREYSYRSAEYYFEEKNDAVKTEFVAEPLMQRFHPDEVFIIGTSKSSWTGFYGKFGEENNKDEIISKLFDLEEKGGKDLSVAEVRAYAGAIEQHFSEGICGGVFAGVKIHVIVTRYGINSGELLENYCLIRDAIGNVLEDNKEKYRYEVAFDITHSFRSMPIYNLVILNYLQNISQIDIEITHVYYGNFDISRENEDLSPIVDLDELIRVLEISNSINEFKNTGNAVSLIRNVPNMEKGFKEALEAFDWATQINDYNAIMDGLRQLIRFSGSKDSSSSGKYADLQEMVLNVIRYKFFAGDAKPDAAGQGKSLVDDLGDMKFNQYRLSKWYYNQNRYGEAVATALEALRSYLVPLYLEWAGKDKDERSLRSEQNRRASIERLKNLAAMIREGKIILPGSQKKAAGILCRLEDARKTAQSIRNIFAHNLGGQEDETDKTVNPKEAKEQIRIFFDIFDEFVELMQTDGAVVEEVYQREPVKLKPAICKDKKARLIVADPDAKVNYEAYRKSVNGSLYSVYRIDPAVLKYLKDNEKKSDSAIFLAEYLKKQELDPDRVQIIFYSLTAGQQVNYQEALRCIGMRPDYMFDESRATGRLPRLLFDASESYARCSEAWKDKNKNNMTLDKLMDKELICVLE